MVHSLGIVNNWNNLFRLVTMVNYILIQQSILKNIYLIWEKTSLHTTSVVVLADGGLGHPENYTYRIAAKYSNENVFQHWFEEWCRIPSWKDLMSQRAHDEGASNATFGWWIWYHLAKLHVYEIRRAFEYLEVIRYMHYETHIFIRSQYLQNNSFGWDKQNHRHGGGRTAWR